MPISAVDSISPAWTHMKQQLFQPFRWGQWLRLAVVGLLAGELSSTGSCNFSGANWNKNRHPSEELLSLPAGFPNFDPAKLGKYVGLILLAVFVIFVLYMLLIYVSSVFRFILFDSVLRKHCSIRQGWDRWHSSGRRFFLWRMVFLTASSLAMGVFIGIPLLLAAAAGWLKDPKEHVAPLVLVVFVIVVMVACTVLAMLVVEVFSRDFLVPIMALEDVDFADGWSRFFSIMREDKGSYVGYLLLKIVMAIGALFVIGIATFLAVFAFLIPVGGAGAAAVLLGKAAGLTWNAATITAGIVAGSLALAVLIYLISLVAVPTYVFFPAYSIYFFASRYPRLDAILHPAPPPVDLPPLPAIALAPYADSAPLASAEPPQPSTAPAPSEGGQSKPESGPSDEPQRADSDESEPIQ